jgi:hypothetical protein
VPSVGAAVSSLPPADDRSRGRDGRGSNVPDGDRRARALLKRDVGARFGPTRRRYSSRHDGHISRCGDAMVRAALYQAANVLLHHGRWSSLRSWAMRIPKRSIVMVAKVALAAGLPWSCTARGFTAPICVGPRARQQQRRWRRQSRVSQPAPHLNRFTGSAVTAERGARAGARVGRARIAGCGS